MAHYLIHWRGYYLTWSSILDSPTDTAMNEAECLEHLTTRYGLNQDYTLLLMVTSQRNHPVLIRQNSIENVQAIKETNEEFMMPNRAGTEEACLSLDELYQQYCLERQLPDVNYTVSLGG